MGERAPLRLALVATALVLLPLGAAPASADCTVLTSNVYADMNFTTICLDEEVGWDDGTQTWTSERLAHVTHGVEADPVFDYAYVRGDRDTWTYDDGEIQHRREMTHVGLGTFQGARGLVGTGVHANLHQRDQTAPEDGDGACSGVVGRSTCVGAGSWLTIQGVFSVGLGVYYQQSGTGSGCEEAYSVYLDAGVFVPVTPDARPCTTEAPDLYRAPIWEPLP